MEEGRRHARARGQQAGKMLGGGREVGQNGMGRFDPFP